MSASSHQSVVIFTQLRPLQTCVLCRFASSADLRPLQICVLCRFASSADLRPLQICVLCRLAAAGWDAPETPVRDPTETLSSELGMLVGTLMAR